MFVYSLRCIIKENSQEIDFNSVVLYFSLLVIPLFDTICGFVYILSSTFINNYVFSAYLFLIFSEYFFFSYRYKLFIFSFPFLIFSFSFLFFSLLFLFYFSYIYIYIYILNHRLLNELNLAFWIIEIPDQMLIPNNKHQNSFQLLYNHLIYTLYFICNLPVILPIVILGAILYVCKIFPSAIISDTWLYLLSGKEFKSNKVLDAFLLNEHIYKQRYYMIIVCI